MRTVKCLSIDLMGVVRKKRYTSAALIIQATTSSFGSVSSKDNFIYPMNVL